MVYCLCIVLIHQLEFEMTGLRRWTIGKRTENGTKVQKQLFKSYKRLKIKDRALLDV